MKLDEIKLGIVGLGGYSAQYLKIYRAHPKITYLAAAEFYEERREKYKDCFDRVYSSFDEMLACDKEINCVGIFAQRHQHGPLIIQALRAGYNVMTAVPMGCTLDEIKEIVEIVNETGLKFMMLETCYYWPCAEYARKKFLAGEFGKFTFIDTAGIRRSSKVNDKIEKYSVLRAHMAVERADVCLIMIDAGEGITEQDEKIAGIAHEAGKASIIVVNKWDSIEKDNRTVNEYNEQIRTALAYMPYAPITYVSALTGQRLNTLYEHIVYVNNQAKTRISTGMLNDVLADATMKVQPPSDKGKRLKIYYMTQISVAPPTFVIFCNDVELFHFSYQRYIENCLRQVFGFKGTPIKLIIRMKGEEV